jgi:hypothetical protein
VESRNRRRGVQASLGIIKRDYISRITKRKKKRMMFKNTATFKIFSLFLVVYIFIIIYITMSITFIYPA